MNDGSDSLQALCMAALRQHRDAPALVAAAAEAAAAEAAAAAEEEKGAAAEEEEEEDEDEAPAMPTDGPPPEDEDEVPIFTQSVNALFEFLSMDGSPGLQVEAAHTLIDLFDKLTLPQQHAVQDDAVGVLLDCLRMELNNDDDDDDDDVTWTKASAVVREIVNGNCDLRRNLILGPIVRGVMANDDEVIQFNRATNLGCILAIDPDPPVQRVLETGILPRLVEFLGRDDVPDLQYVAARILADLAFKREHTAVVVHANAIDPFVRLLRSPYEHVVKHAVLGVIELARHSPDQVLHVGAVRPLVDVAMRTRDSLQDVCLNATAALNDLVRAEHGSPIELFRPELPALAQLTACQHGGVVSNVCNVLLRYQSETSDGGDLQEFIDAGIYPRLVELLSHPRLKVQKLASWMVGNLLVNSDEQEPAILEYDPLPSLRALLQSPDLEVQSAACRAIAHYLFNDDQVQALIDCNAVPSLVHLLASPDLDVREIAAMAILNYTVNGTVDQIQLLVSAGCIPPLCGVLTVDTQQSQAVAWALEGLVHILRAGSELEQDEGSNPMAMLVPSSLLGKLTVLEELRENHVDEDARRFARELLEQCFPIEEMDKEDVEHRPN